MPLFQPIMPDFITAAMLQRRRHRTVMRQAHGAAANQAQLRHRRQWQCGWA